jgi:putative cardiolipin synthase
MNPIAAPVRAQLGRLLGALAWLPLVAVVSACAALPADVQRAPTEAMSDVAGTDLARAASSVTPDDQRHLSGLHLLPNGPDAFAVRIDLARRAQKTLDVQYYVIAPDQTGRQFLRELRDAAQRGVRVRLLIDDLHVSEQDDLLRGLAAYDNVQLRLFNPLPVRGSAFQARMLMSLHQFERLNRRMHNKLFIADNSVAVTGGRNIANAYFMRSDEANFIDLDVLSIGPVVSGLSAVFDRYWNSEQAFPIEALVAAKEPAAAARARFDAWVERDLHPIPDTQSPQPLPSTPVATGGALGAAFETLPLQFAPVQIFADDPSKATGDAPPQPGTTALDSTLLMLRSARSEVMVVSPYFVPGERGLEMMRSAVDQGIQVSVMTNSLAATDEPLAYWGYARYRAAMLKMGVSLSELSPVPNRKVDLLGDFRSSLGRLHAKVAVVDRRWLLVGSMNMDRRSSRSNTEVGLVIDHAALADEAITLVQRHWSNNHYRLRLADAGDGVEWVEGDAATTPVVHRAEPFVGWLERMRLGVLSIFVSEELL